MEKESLQIVVLAGPNGAGKSTVAPTLLQGVLRVPEFVNADTIAQGLSAFGPDRAAMAAGRIMVGRLKELARKRVSFAFETTLASRSFAPWIADLIESGYEFHLVFLWLPDVDTALARISERVRMGGHSVPEETVRRRYRAGLVNFFRLYQPMTRTWQVLDNSGEEAPRKIAVGRGVSVDIVSDAATWERILRGFRNAHPKTP